MEYRITQRSHWYALINSLGLYTVVFIIICLVILWRNGFEYFEDGMLGYAFGFYLFMVIPALIIYLEYYLKDKDVIIRVFNDKGVLIYTKQGVEKEIKFQEVKQFDVIGEIGNFAWFPASTFCFARLLLQNGEELFFTNLLKYKLDKIFPNIEVNKRRWIFPSILFFKTFRTNDDMV